ncbi:MAG: hypothetical protein MdMp024_0018 [Bacteroidales bacterium]
MLKDLPTLEFIYVPGLPFRIALVDKPANHVSFVMLKEKEEKKIRPVLLSMNEEKRELFGVALRADYPVYRYYEELGEFYLNYSPAQIEGLVLDVMRSGQVNNICLGHDSKENMSDISCKESYLSKEGVQFCGEDIAAGSWFVTLKAWTEEAWATLKNSAAAGFSPEMFGIFEKAKLQEHVQMMDWLKNKPTPSPPDPVPEEKRERFTEPKNLDAYLAKLSEQLKEKKVELAHIVTDKGTLATVNMLEEFEVGARVLLIDAEGKATIPPAGDYTAGNVIYTVSLDEWSGYFIIKNIRGGNTSPAPVTLSEDRIREIALEHVKSLLPQQVDLTPYEKKTENLEARLVAMEKAIKDISGVVAKIPAFKDEKLMTPPAQNNPLGYKKIGT